jgi:hypothetical protein
VLSDDENVITSVKMGDNALDSANYTIAEGGHSVAIKKAFVATLSDGEVTFKAMAGDTACVTGTVTISGALAVAFDRANPADVTIEVSDATITGVKLGDDAVDSSNITIASGSHSVTIKKEFLATLSNGVKEFTVMASTTECLECDVTISGDHTAAFDRADAADVSVGAADATITGLKLGDTEVDSGNYAISNSDHTLTIKKEYLTTLSNGVKTFKILEGATDFDTLVVTVSGAGSAEFSKADPADITISVVDAEITGLKNGTEAVSEESYSIAEGAHSITIDDAYLGDLDNGDVTFSIELEDADPVVYVVTVGA